MKLMSRIYPVFQAIIRLIMKIFWHLEIVNQRRILSARNCIIASNHISWFDPPFIGSIFPFEINYLAKAELFRNKMIGNFLKSVNAIPIKRGRIDRKAIELVEKKLAKGQSILLFPEGTRRSSKPKPGIGKIAIQTKKDILPLYIENSNHFRKCLFGKERLIIKIGRKFRYREFSDFEEKKEDYRKLSEIIFQKIKELADEG